MSTETGKTAEDFAARYLEKIGFEVVEKNWRTPFCEIDIIAKRNDTVHFVEVKYRKNSKQGWALDYVTPSKVKQLKYAAKNWVKENKWSKDYQIDAIGITGELDIRNIEYVQEVR